MTAIVLACNGFLFVWHSYRFQWNWMKLEIIIVVHGRFGWIVLRSSFYPFVFQSFSCCKPWTTQKSMNLLMFHTILNNKTNLGSFSRSFVMKSIASCDTVSNASSRKSYLPIVTLAMVSTSVSPAKGDKPDTLSLNLQSIWNRKIYRHCSLTKHRLSLLHSTCR